MYILVQNIVEHYIKVYMIFITLGTQPCDFSRCMSMVEQLVITKNINERVIAQIGYTNFKSSVVECYDFISEDKYQEFISEARVVISHAGTGALFSSIKKGKKVIAVARLKEYGEMINNHQLEIVKKLSGEGYILDGTESLIEMWEQLDVFIPRKFDLENNIPEDINKVLDEWFHRK